MFVILKDWVFLSDMYRLLFALHFSFQVTFTLVLHLIDTLSRKSSHILNQNKNFFIVSHLNIIEI